MIKIVYDSKKHDYNPIIKTFFISEKDVAFATTYEIVNPKTKQGKVFDFTHSTGSEWDADTRWVYATKDGEYTLWVGNDAEVTKARADAYLKGKLDKKAKGGYVFKGDKYEFFPATFIYEIGGL